MVYAYPFNDSLKGYHYTRRLWRIPWTGEREHKKPEAEESPHGRIPNYYRRWLHGP